MLNCFPLLFSKVQANQPLFKVGLQVHGENQYPTEAEKHPEVPRQEEDLNLGLIAAIYNSIKGRQQAF